MSGTCACDYACEKSKKKRREAAKSAREEKYLLRTCKHKNLKKNIEET